MDDSQLKTKTLSGIIWKFLERFCAQGVSLIVSIVLARILMPDDYSVVSIVAIFFAFCNVIISGGFSQALVQKKEVDIIDYSTTFYFSMFLALIMYALMFFLAAPIANLYDKPILIPMIRVMGISFFIYAFKSVVCAKISKEMNFRKFFWSTIIGTVISAFIGIFMAIKGYGAWALVAQQMSNSIIDTLILVISTKFKIALALSFPRLKILFRYGWKLYVASLITVAYDEAKPLIVGVKFSPTDLAFYTKGKQYPQYFNSTVSNTMSGVLFPALSKLQDDKSALLSATRRYIKTSSYLIFPLLLGLFAVASNFVEVVLTAKWLEIVPFMQIFCICYMFDLIHIGNLQAIKAIGRTDISLITEIIKKSSYLLIILAFVFWSDMVIVFALSNICCNIVAIIVNTYPNRKLLGYSYKLQIFDILKNLISAIIMATIVYLMNFIVMNKLLLLILQILAGMIIYLLLSIVLRNENYRYCLKLIKSIFSKKEKTEQRDKDKGKDEEMKLTISEKTPNLSYEELTELLHEAYKEWIDKGIMFYAGIQDAKTTANRIKDKHCLVALIDEKLVGTVTYRIENNGLYFEMFAVLPQYKNNKIGTKLLEELEKIAKSKNLDFISMDTSKKAKRLISFYEKKGFVKCELKKYSNVNYYSIVFRKDLNGKDNKNSYKRNYKITYLHMMIGYSLKKTLRKAKNILRELTKCFVSIFLPLKYIIFESEPDFSDNVFPVFEEMMKKGINKKYTLVWWVKDKNNVDLQKYKDVKYIDINNNKEFYHYLFRAKALIFGNKLMNVYNYRTKSFCLFHGAKNKKTRGIYEMPKHLDYFLMNAKSFEGITRYEFNMSKKTKLLYLGYPRNDELFVGKKKDFHNYLDTAASKMVVWYPTFRTHKNNINKSRKEIPILENLEQLKILDEVAKKNDCLIIVKFHFMGIQKDLDYSELKNIKFINDSFFIERGITSYQFLGMSDALITDYSSVFYDYLLIDKPICLVWADFEEYKANFPFDPIKMYRGGQKAYNLEDLCAFIKDLKNKDLLKEEREEMKKYCNEYFDDKSAERVANFIYNDILKRKE